MDPISQGALGAAAAESVATRSKLRAWALLGCLAGMAPDVDVFIGSADDPLLFLEYHRQFTHALVFIPVGAMVVALVLHWTVRRTLTPMESYLACLAGYATHGFLDACTSYGTQLLWPFTDERFAWNNVSVVDPLFTLPLLGLVVAAAVTRRRILALVGLAWAAGYLLLGVVQTQRVEAAVVALAAERGHQPNRVTVKAGFANLLLWKVIYEHGGRYHVDAVRAGLNVSVCPGTSVATLDVGRDLPWLDPDSQQARDVERFRWFSDDYLALDPGNPHGVIDIRYSVVPNRIDPLWGIVLRRDVQPGSHVAFFANETIGPGQRSEYLQLLTGDGCGATIPSTPTNEHGRHESRNLAADS